MAKSIYQLLLEAFYVAEKGQGHDPLAQLREAARATELPDGVVAAALAAIERECADAMRARCDGLPMADVNLILREKSGWGVSERFLLTEPRPVQGWLVDPS